VEGYRLPTEAEWEYAARGGHKSTGDYKYAGSNYIEIVAWYRRASASFDALREVGQKQPNELGIYDMSGNLWEMCYDKYDDKYYQKSPTENPVNLTGKSHYVIRGGAWDEGEINNRVYFRLSVSPTQKNYNRGFRIARTRYVSPPQNEYTLTIEASPPDGGKVSGGDNYEVGEAVNFSAIANIGYQFVNWTKRDVEISTKADDTYEMPSENVTLVANFQKKNVPIPGMVTVLRGSFQMGNTRDDSEGYGWEKPVHTVKLTYDYYIGKTEVTFDEYDAYCKATGKRKPDDEGWGRGDRHVIDVSWEDAIAYCNWLSIENGYMPVYDKKGNMLDENGNITTDITKVKGYRLPTEAEWEYAARGGHKDIKDGVEANDYKYAGSNDGDEVVGHSGNIQKIGTQPVGTKLPNELGLYDMSGNVRELCHDWFAVDYPSKPQTNPVNHDRGSQSNGRVVRGGVTLFRSEFCRVASRIRIGPDVRYRDTGFRIAKTQD